MQRVLRNIGCLDEALLSGRDIGNHDDRTARQPLGIQLS
jgi:hypothetical protein